MKVRDLIRELVEFEADAEIAVDTNFSSVLGEEEGLEKYVEPCHQEDILCLECYETIKERIDNGGRVNHCKHD